LLIFFPAWRSAQFEAQQCVFGSALREQLKTRDSSEVWRAASVMRGHRDSGVAGNGEVLIRQLPEACPIGICQYTCRHGVDVLATKMKISSIVRAADAGFRREYIDLSGVPPRGGLHRHI
jgi:hypothetical protein